MSKDMLYKLIDCIDEQEYDLLGKLLLKFVKEESPLPDEIASTEAAKQEFLNGDYISAKDFNWGI